MRSRTRFFVILCCLLSVLLCVGTAGEALAAKKKKGKPAPETSEKYAAIVIDAQTGRVLWQENADRTLHPASLTKIMTMTLAFDAMRAGRISEWTQLRASQHSVSMPPSKAGLRVGGTISVHDALRVLATKSANDVAATVAENLGGSESRFAMMMNIKAREIGMTNTRFVNASGLHDYRQVSSARDMARLGKYVIDNYPEYYSIFGLRQYRYAGRTMQNHNHLMKSYQGMDGIKTGYVTASGFNLVASAKRGGRRVIGVVFGGRSAASRNARMAKLLDEGFRRLNAPAGEAYAALNDNVAPQQQAAKSQIAPAPVIAHDVPLPRQKPMMAGTKIETTNNRPQQAAVAQVPAYSTPVTPAPSPSPSPSPAPAAAAAPVASTSGSLGTLVIPAQGSARAVAVAPTTAYQQPAPQQAIPQQGGSVDGWQIQIGAYEDRTMTNKALYDAMLHLPPALNKGKTLVVPLRTPDAKWIFRARLAGYTQPEAVAACTHLKATIKKDCLPIAP